MLVLSLFSAAFALFSFIPYDAGLSSSATWTLCTAPFAVSGVAVSVYALKKQQE